MCILNNTSKPVIIQTLTLEGQILDDDQSTMCMMRWVQRLTLISVSHQVILKST